MTLKKLAPRQLDLGQVNGFEVTPESPAGNQVEVAAGNYLDYVTLVIQFKPAVTSVSFGTVVPGQERYDLLYYSTAGALTKLVGVSQPVGTGISGAPAIPLGSLPLAFIYVDETATVVVDSADITDIRNFFNQPSHRNLSGIVTIHHDSVQVNHTKAIPANWNVVTNPQTEKILLDELAARMKFQETSKTFLSLTDTFPSYAGRALQYLRVNAGQTAIETVAIAGLPNVGMHSAKSYLEVDANAGGIQTATIIITTPVTALTTLPPFKVDLSLHVHVGDTWTTVNCIIDLEVFRVYEAGAGTFYWLAVLKNRPGVDVAFFDFLAGTYAPDPVSMTKQNAHVYDNGPWYKESTATAIGTPLLVEVARMKLGASGNPNPNVLFSWNAGLKQLTIQLSSDGRAVAMPITLHYNWNES